MTAGGAEGPGVHTAPTNTVAAAQVPARQGLPGARQLVRAALLLVLLIALLAVGYFSPLREHLRNLRDVSNQIQRMGVWAPLAFTAAVAILVPAGVPRLPFCPIAGMAFGFVRGVLWSQLGTLIGYYLVFLFVRWGGRAFVLRHSARLRGLTDLFQHQGIPTVILARQFPIHGSIINLLLSLSPVNHRDFLIGTAIGLVPESIPVTLIGTGAVQASFARSAGIVTVAVVVLASVWIGFGFYLRGLQRTRRERAAAAAETAQPS